MSAEEPRQIDEAKYQEAVRMLAERVERAGDHADVCDIVTLALIGRLERRRDDGK